MSLGSIKKKNNSSIHFLFYLKLYTSVLYEPLAYKGPYSVLFYRQHEHFHYRPQDGAKKDKS